MRICYTGIGLMKFIKTPPFDIKDIGNSFNNNNI